MRSSGAPEAPHDWSCASPFGRGRRGLPPSLSNHRNKVRTWNSPAKRTNKENATPIMRPSFPESSRRFSVAGWASGQCSCARPAGKNGNNRPPRYLD